MVSSGILVWMTVNSKDLPAKDYFQSDEGGKYVDHYDFLPPLDSDRRQDERAFIRYGYCKMRRDLLLRYGLKLHRIRSDNKA